MGIHDEMGSRFKNFESQYDKKLIKSLPVIIRVDGRAFHTFTRGLKKPFDSFFNEAMQETMRYLCKNVCGCVLGYTQSDEISLLVQAYKKEETQPWFDYRVNKICSVTSALATLAFNRKFGDLTLAYYDSCAERETTEDEEKYLKTLLDKLEHGATFDARAFNIPFDEVTNYFYWREIDAVRNSIEAVGHCYFSSKELHGINQKGIKAMLLEKGINYDDDFPTYLKRGSCCYKIKTKQLLENGETAMRTRWIVDIGIPMFRNDDRDYIDSKLGDDYY